MFYRLTCPACRQGGEHLFVRLGAVVSCPSCSHTWRIEAAHVTRINPPPRAAGGAGGPGTPGPAEAVEAPRVLPPRVASSSSGDTAMVGLSGLSEVMRHGGDATGPNGNDDDPVNGGVFVPPPAAGRVPGQPVADAGLVSTARQRAINADRRRRRNALLALVLGLTVMVGTLGSLVAVMAQRENARQAALGALQGLPIAERAAVVLPLGDDRLANPQRAGVRLEPQPSDDPAVLPLRLSTTEAVIDAPVEILIAAAKDGRPTHAWVVIDDRPLTADQDLGLIVRLPGAPGAPETRWVIRPLRPAGWDTHGIAQGPNDTAADPDAPDDGKSDPALTPDPEMEPFE